MSYATCRECGDTFWRDEGEEWKRVCIDCWKEKKRIEASRESELQQEIEQLRSSLAIARREAAAARPFLDRKFIKRIVSLTHPDRQATARRQPRSHNSCSPSCSDRTTSTRGDPP